MQSMRVILCVLLGISAALACGVAAAANPPVRAITVFVDLDAAHFEQQVIDAARGLHAAQARFERAGWRCWRTSDTSRSRRGCSRCAAATPAS
jgi:hypothetical protein